MTWIEIVWLMLGGASLTLAVIHLSVGLSRPRQPAHLMFSLAAASVAVISIMELELMRSTDPAHFGTVLRWVHVPVAILAASLVGFVRLHFSAGRPWLGCLAVALRVGCLVPNFFDGANINYISIEALTYVPVWAAGEVANPVGEANPWMAVAQLSSLLVVAFMIDALRTVRGRGDPEKTRQAWTICGSIALFVLLAGLWSLSLVLDLASGPWTVNALFFIVVLAMSYELGGGVVRAAALARRLGESEAKLHESEQRLHLAARAAGLGIWTWDISSGRYWFTDTALSLLGLAVGKTPDRNRLLAMIEPDDLPTLYAARDEALLGSGEFSCEFRLAGSGERWIAAIGSAERDSSGDPIMVRGALLDVTEPKLLARETILQRDELAHLARVAMLGELSGSIAHELNQPLTAVLSNAQAALRFMRQEPPDLAEVRDSLKDIVENDKRAADVIRRLRTMLRKEEPSYQSLDANELVLDILRLVNSDLLNRNVVVVHDLEPELPGFCGDRVQLQQVLMNLIMNACDAMSGLTDGRQITIRTRELADGQLQIDVRDVGHGIPVESLGRIFEPFMTTKREGIGLGLPICRTIMRAHGGTLEAANHPDGGAILRLTLPAAP